MRSARSRSIEALLACVLAGAASAAGPSALEHLGPAAAHAAIAETRGLVFLDVYAEF